MTDMTNQAIAWMRYQKALTPDKPFFTYFAPERLMLPPRAKSWIEKYKGKLIRLGQTARYHLANQIKLGVVPEKTTGAQAGSNQDWDKLTADERKLFAHQMEVSLDMASTPIPRLAE